MAMTISSSSSGTLIGVTGLSPTGTSIGVSSSVISSTVDGRILCSVTTILVGFGTTEVLSTA